MPSIELPPTVTDGRLLLDPVWFHGADLEALHAAMKQGRDQLQQRLDAARQSVLSGDTGQQVAALHSRHAGFSRDAAATRKELAQAESVLRQALAGGSDKDVKAAQEKVTRHGERLGLVGGWLATLDKQIPQMQAQLDAEWQQRYLQERERFAAECEQQLAAFDAALEEFVMQHLGGVAAAVAGHEAVGGLRESRSFPRLVA
jgi:hypothetical protein